MERISDDIPAEPHFSLKTSEAALSIFVFREALTRRQTPAPPIDEAR